MDDNQLAEELRLTVGRLVRTVRAADTMPSGEAAVLGYLDRGGPLTTADVAHRWGVSHQSAARAVKDLLGQGLLHAEAHPSDGRKLLLHLTPAGSDRLAEERRRRADWLGTAISEALAPDEREALAKVLPLLSRLDAHLKGK
ncbi:MarR family winged helix-turn-helix transcriptional regulator [Streptomyces morookaense]|uniref:MarR family transcriptional regulator n=1 Tax=Streptomyces morookaense TaxID=1970 RepID=A0A7Y7B7B0_STRMO|nr:MarR family transcriptional regulator [Streptomyces morookaense]NVK80230.1 MarR family transcriptional regulator [Streptomyces morookaense]GHF40464.1 MarR family transcriptional regulator [Streptomyces morookaense]